MPLSRKVFTISKSRSTMAGARPCDISSTISSRGRQMSARARASICCSPPDNEPAACPRRRSSDGKVTYASSTRRVTSAPSSLASAAASRSDSSTRRLGKMPRPSGTCSSPRRVIRSAGWPAMSAPSKRTVPSMTGIIPEMARKVVVLPAPLSPSRATISPSPTLRSIPKMTGSRPYPARRPETSNSAAI